MFPRVDLGISPPKPEGGKEDDIATTIDGWDPPEPSSNPTKFWGSKDKDLLPLVGTTLAV